jgi:hypothetical protein
MSTPVPAAVPAQQLAPNALQKLLDFLAKLDQYKHHYRLSCHRDEAIMVELAVPGERWEVEFFADGEVEVERFRSNGHIADESELAELFTTFAD